MVSARIPGLCALALFLGAQSTLAETQMVIDPTETSEPARPPARAAKKAPGDAAVKRERQRAQEGERRQAEAAAKEAAAKAAARRAAAARAAAARAAVAREARARAAAERVAAGRAAALRAAAEAEAAAREAAARQAAARELAEREAAARELAARQAAEAAARETAAREAAAREAAVREAAAREAAAKETAARERTMRFAAARQARSDSFSKRPAKFGTVFRDCAECPELVWLPQGEFLMGENRRQAVRIDYTLAVGRFEITFSEWDACVVGGGCRRRPDDSGWGRGRQPVVNVSWSDARQYVAWLARKTGERYRLLSEAEWEYAARAGSQVGYWWGNEAGQGEANCSGCGSRWDGRRTAPVGSFAPNPFGLHDMHGNVSEWVEDCHRDTPSDAKMFECSMLSGMRLIRGGAWRDAPHATRSGARAAASLARLDNRIGFRVARTD